MNLDQLKLAIKNKEKLRIIDIREASEIKNKLPEAEHIPRGQVFVDVSSNKISKKDKLIFICKSSGRCQIVADKLKEKGFDVDFLEGGMDEWEVKK